jgi:dynein heavy chain, axonemal
MFIEDVIMLAAMKPPGGGNPAITGRFLRHFNVIAYTDMSDSTIIEIFSRLTKHFLRRFNENITTHIESLSSEVMNIYTRVKSELLPTPKKSHYTFNLRDIWKVFQGICSASQKYCVESVDLIRLYYHECARVFQDRLTDKLDIDYFSRIVQDTFKTFSVTSEEVFDQDRIIMADFLYGRDVEPRHYTQVNDLP